MEYNYGGSGVQVSFPGLNGWLRAPGSIVSGFRLDYYGLRAPGSIAIGSRLRTRL